MVSQEKVEAEPLPLYMQVGRKLSHPPHGEEIVIAGLSGTFPESRNVKEFEENLFNKVDMITSDDRRWKLEHPRIPKRTGKIPVVNKFDASYFGIHYQQSKAMDPLCRIVLEKTYEAIVDAGVNPGSLRGRKIGVFFGSCFSESQKSLFYEELENRGMSITGGSCTMQPNRVSYWLGVNGPSIIFDSACSSSLYALEQAYISLREGHCDAAILGASQLCLHPFVSLQFCELGVLSPDGRCKAFDKNANGYVRGEAIGVMYLQKARDAKRIYSTIVHAKTNCDGYKEHGITYPSGDIQRLLIHDFYKECQTDPTDLCYVEAHGTGTRVGDPEELNAIDQICCTGRKEPLRIGSVKSNMGHTEPASGICSIVKVLIAMETGYIPPNLNYNEPREGVNGLIEGRLEVVTKKSPLTGDLVGVNSFGFGGANAHVLLKKNTKTKVNGGAPSDSLPRLVIASGRTEEAVDSILKEFESRPVDAEYVHLVQDLQSTNFHGHFYRGFTIVHQNVKPIRSIQFYQGDKRPLWFIFTGLESQWPGMGRSLLSIPIFAAAIEKCHAVLKQLGVDLTKIITSNDPSFLDNIANCYVGITAIQIGLVDVLKAVGLEPVGVIGHSFGELACSYTDGSLTAEQTILAAYYQGLAVSKTELVKGSMVFVGLGAKQAASLCPPDIEVACHNGPRSCTLSGPAESVKTFVQTLHQNGVSVKEINNTNTALHSRYIATVGPLMLNYLKKVIPDPKPRTSCWVSSSIPESEWNKKLATHSSAEYFTNNLLSPVLFEEALQHIPRNAITVEIAPRGFLQNILKQSLHKSVTNITLAEQDQPDNALLLLTNLGRLYELGLQPKLTKLYPPIQYPVSRGTPMISPLIKWEHSVDWPVLHYDNEKSKAGQHVVKINVDQVVHEYLRGHVIDGRNLFPAMGYVFLVWESFAKSHGKFYTELPVVFENMRFHRATNIPKEGSLEFIIQILRTTGKFEIMEGGAPVVSGIVRLPKNKCQEAVKLEAPEESDSGLIQFSSRDIYKELRLRGYNYQGLFRALVSVDGLCQRGIVTWNKNWVSFMDNMLQMKILQEDTRSLFVPTSLKKLTIDVAKHNAEIEALGAESDEIEVPVYVNKHVNIIWSAGIQISGLKASAIPRRKPLGDPVLEKYVFVPNVEPELDLKDALRACMHIALENQFGIQVKSVEMYSKDYSVLSPELSQILGDLPLIQADITLLIDHKYTPVPELEVVGYKVKEESLSAETNCMFVIIPNLLNSIQLLQTAVSSLSEGGCILARQNLNSKHVYVNQFGLEVVFEKTLENEKFILLKKGFLSNSVAVIEVNSHSYDWLPQVQTAVANNLKKQIFLLAQGEPLSGILGLVNCIRKEPGGESVRCVFVVDKSAPKFDLSLPFYRQQLSKDLAINIYKNGKWGSYRHLPLESLPLVSTPYAYCNFTTLGDLSSLRWLTGNLCSDSTQKDIKFEPVIVYYSALNFRDVMLATGKISVESITNVRLSKECVLGFEISGRDTKGNRVMGMTAEKAMATAVMADPTLLWRIPDHWSFEDAATIPVVYGTVYFALFVSGRLKKGDTVLIHAGSGGVGQAAINVCLHAGCKVFTTVGTQEKRDFIKKCYPQLTDRQIGNSRDTSFEQLIKQETDGRGVDIVLNSLADEKLQASLRCLAFGGRFLEIGKYDLQNNSPLAMELFLKGISFHGVMLDKIFVGLQEEKQRIFELVSEGIKSGAVQPLIRTVFSHDEVEQAFRFLAAGKHIGKVLLKIRSEEDSKIVIPEHRLMEAVPSYFCYPECSYIITGGLGGFGLELADWLVLRGARNLVLTSRSGIRNGYQCSRVKTWRSYGVKVEISLCDITIEKGTKELLAQANKLGPVDAIFNLAVVLRDALLENQTEADFKTSAGPKAIATHHLDLLSRKMCPKLRHFVVFSSVSCGRGNAGQTNYGMSNSIMERICEARVRDGLPGLAVQWGAVGEVGLVADMQEENTEIVIGGTLPQKISSCLEELDSFLNHPYPIVASMVVAEKRANSVGSGNILDYVGNILGIRDLKSISFHSTLAELGMDSMMTVEIKQTLEREFEVFLTAQEVRNLTFTHLSELALSTLEVESSSNEKSISVAPSASSANEGLQLMFRVVGDEASATKTILRLPSLTGAGNDIEDVTKAGPVLFMFPGVEGVASVLEPLAKNLNYQTVCLQFGCESFGSTVQEMAKSLLPYVQRHLKPSTPFHLLGYSFGGLIAMEIAHYLEEQGMEGHLILVDSSPTFLKLMQEVNIGSNEEELDIKLLSTILYLMAPQQATPNTLKKLTEELSLLKSYEEKLDQFLKMLPPTDYSPQYQKAIGMSAYVRIKAISKYSFLNKPLKSKTILLRPSTSWLVIEEDYGLSKFCEKQVDVNSVTGNHVTILDNRDTANIINNLVRP